MSTKVWDAIVVGLGAAGAGALLSLAKRARHVLGIECQAATGHERGSSHGLSRIIRTSYYEHPSYVPLVQKAWAAWIELEATTGLELLKRSGCLSAKESRFPAAAAAAAAAAPGEYSLDCYEGAIASARQWGLPHEILNSKQLSSMFPGYASWGSDYHVFFEKQGGVLAPEVCLKAMTDVAQSVSSTTRILWNQKVMSWHQTSRPTDSGGSSSHITVRLSSGDVYTARSLIIATGPWIQQLLPQLRPLLTVERQVVCWFQLSTPQLCHDFSPERFPPFLLHDKDGMYVYGFPADQHGFKVGVYHHRRQHTKDAGEVNWTVEMEDETVLRRAVSEHFPALRDAAITKSSVCLFTNTPSGHFLMDQIQPGVIVVSACSGHGFKFAPVLGDIAADLALQNGHTNNDIRIFRMDSHLSSAYRM